MRVGDSGRHAAEQWFRRRGLPAVIRGRPTQLLVRIVPAMVFLAVLELIRDVLSVVDGKTDAEFERLMDSDVFVLAYIGLLFSGVVLPPVAAWLAMRWVRRRTAVGVTGRPHWVVAAGVVAAYLLAWPVVGHLTGNGSTILGDTLLNAGLAGLIYAVAFVGGGAITGWAIRAAVRQLRLLGSLASRALPLLLLFTIFGFFTGELWQATTVLARPRMWLVVAFFVVVSVLFMTANLADEVRELNTVRPSAEGLDKLRDSPFGPLVDDHVAENVQHVPLRRPERANMILVLLLGQAFQALVFATLMFAFFVTFGVLALRREVMKAWSAHDLSTGTLFGVQFPVPNELLQVSIFLAAFCALYFVVSTASDARYRQSYFAPLVDHMAVSLTARQIYLAHWVPTRPRTAS